MNLSIVIITYKRLHLLENCLKSIQKNTLKSYQLFIVINGPDTSTEKYLEGHPLHPQVLTLAKKYSPAEARNTAISLCQNDFILFLDDDTELPPDYLQKGLDFILTNKNVDVFGGPDSSSPQSDLLESSLGLALQSPLLTAHTRRRHTPQLSQIQSCDETSLILCALWFRSSIFKKDKFLFDSRFFRNEENVLLYQLKQNNFTLFHCPQLLVIHRKKKELKKILQGVWWSGHYRAKSLRYRLSCFHPLFFMPAFTIIFSPVLFVLSPSFFLAGLVLYLFLIILCVHTLEKKLSKTFALMTFFHPLFHISYGLGFIHFFIKPDKNNQFPPSFNN